MSREAMIKLTLNGGSFVTTMDQMNRKTREFSAAARKNFSEAFGAGGMGAINGMKQSLADVGGMLKGHLATAATLGGAVGIGSMVSRAVSFREKVRDIEFAMNKAGKVTVGWADLMKDAEDAANATGQSSSELADAMSNIFSQTGDADFARFAMEQIGHAASASGKEVGKLADVAAMLRRKFGADAAQLPQMLAAFIEKSDAGGLSLDDLGAKFGLLAGEAVDAGFSGSKGLSSLLGMLEMLNARVGEKAEPALKKLFQVLKNGSKDLKGLQQAAGVKFDVNATGLDRIRKLLETERGRKAITSKLGGEQRVVFDELSKPFNEAFDQAKKSGAKTKDATQAGLAAFDAAMTKLTKTTLTYEQLVEESKAGQAEDPANRLKMAIEKVEQAFRKPEMMDAIDKLAESLPELAQGLIKLMNFVTKHPLLAGSIALGGKVGMGALSGFASGFAEKLMGNLKLAEGTEKRLENAAGGFMTSIEKSGGWKRAAMAAGATMVAALAAYEIGKEAIDAGLKEDFDKKLARSNTAADADSMVKHGVGSDKERAAASAELRRKIKQMEKEGGPGAITEVTGFYASALSGGAVKNPVIEFHEQLNKLRTSLNALEADTAKRKQDELAASSDKAAKAMNKLAGVVSNIEVPSGTPTGTSKGVPTPRGGSGTPGHAPVPG
jgi:hypothetical protein